LKTHHQRRFSHCKSKYYQTQNIRKSKYESTGK
jgi:hypothetical protein